MRTSKFPDDTIATIEDFRACNWMAAVIDENLSCMSAQLSSLAKIALDEGLLSKAKILWLLADASSMLLNPESINTPFRPMMEMGDRRTAVPDDFAPSDVELFSEIYKEIELPRLRARIADLVWLLGRPKNPVHANAAIDAYIATAPEVDDWYTGGREAWTRAVSLAKALKTGAGDRLALIESTLISAFRSAPSNDGYFSLHLAQLLYNYGLARADYEVITNTLRAIGISAESTGNFQSARDHFEATSKWLQRYGSKSEGLKLITQVAECWVSEAKARISGASPSYVVAASFYENAIQTYRTLPRKERERLGVDARISELHTLLTDSGNRSLGEMSQISTPSIDISELVDAACKMVRGKPAPDALLAFSELYLGPRVDKLRDAAIISMREHPLSALFSSTHVSKDGRVIAKSPGVGLDGSTSEDSEAAIWSQSVKNYLLEISLVVQGQIWPAYEVLAAEHRLTEADFMSMLVRSPIVPKGRERLFAKGLFAGYDRDFTSAIHLLIPQVENMVRYHLKAAGVKTTNLDKDGIENENGLSTLVDLQEMTTIFGINLTFELKALFCSAFGPNLRNQVAHGLLEYGECESYPAVYAWWLVLRLTFNAFWNSLHADLNGKNKEQEESS